MAEWIISVISIWLLSLTARWAVGLCQEKKEVRNISDEHSQVEYLLAGDVTGLPELEERDFLDIGVNLSSCGKSCFCLDLCEQYYSESI